MDELVDELSSAMIDVDNCGANCAASNDIDINSIQSNAEMKSQKNHKPVTRSASILIRSKLLILSDSESDDDTKNQLLARKCKRINKKQNNLSKNLYTNERQLNDKLRLQMQLTYTGKRKRSSTISEPNQSNPNPSITQMECDTAISEASSLSETSDDYDSDNNFDGDDEQSDFYEVIAKSKNCTKPRHHNHSRPIDFAVPSTRNPFLTMGLSSSSATSSYSSSLSSANMLWKRRRRMH